MIFLIILLLSTSVCSASGNVNCGVDNLIDTDFDLLKHKRVVLVTHAAARARTGRSTAEEFLLRPEVNTLRLLAPEHGYYGVIRAGVKVQNDSVSGVPVLSLYGSLRRPSKEMISDADVVVVDMQDIGSRSYTYISTMTEVMEACAEHNVPMMILDRPNPLGGLVVDGNLPDRSIKSFVARLPVPYVHGMTMGELAQMINGEGWLEKDPSGVARKCRLMIIKCKRWFRTMSWEETGLNWYPTSPNIPSIDAARGYAVTGLSGELGLVSIGIGTSGPFTMIGAPSFPHDPVLVSRLRSFGVIARRGHFKPIAGKHAKKICEGYHLAFKRDGSFKPFHAAMGMMFAITESNPELLKADLRNSSRAKMFVKTSGTSRFLNGLYTHSSWGSMKSVCSESVAEFREKRDPYLLYDL